MEQISAEALVLEIGKTMVMCQVAEKHMKSYLIYMLPRHKSYKSLLSLEKKYKRKTLSELISELREATEIPDNFEIILRSFLDHRNEFIHNLIHRQDFGFAGSQANTTYDFVRQLYIEAATVSQVFWNVTKIWGNRELGMDSKLFEGLDLSL